MVEKRLIKHPDEIQGLPHNINVESWRALTEEKNNLIIITNTCFAYKIKDLNISKFFEIYNKNEIIIKDYEFVRVNPVCPFCYGSGKSDWVSNITKKQRETRAIDFEQNKMVESRKLIGKDYKEYIVNSPKLKEEEELCNKCNGTGLYLFVDYYVEVP